jgi:hypothetical protein
MSDENQVDKKKIIKNSKEDGIKADIRQGKEYEIIALKWETSIDYVKNVASEMVLGGEKLPDRRNKEWKIYQFLTKRNIENEE